MTRTGKDTLHHDDLVGTPVVKNLPQWANGDVAYYFKTASEYEKRGPYAIAFQIALPRELTHEQHLNFAQDFADALMHNKAYLIVKHEPVKDGQPQPHLHVLMGLRNEDDIARKASKHFQRWNAAHPELGGAQKDRFWNQRQAPGLVRHAITDLGNFHMELAGIERRIDPRSLRKQGIERDRISWNNPATLDDSTIAREQAQAIESWTHRKAYKGISDVSTIPREEFVLLVRQWTREYAPGTALPRADPSEVAAYRARKIARLAQQQADIAVKIRLHTRHLHRLTPQPGRAPGEHARGGGYRVKLYEEERYERDQGRGF
jgi:hypothetical protein